MTEHHNKAYHRNHCKPRKHPRPKRPNAVISGWYGQKIDSTHAIIVITGEGFGDIAGSVKLIANGLGSKVAAIVSWSENVIIVQAPVNKTISSATVYVLDERGHDKKSVTTNKKETRGTGTSSPSWTVESVDDSESAITIIGTSLDDVEDVFLYDNDVPQFVEASAFALDGDDLVIEWPASFVSPIVTVILSDGNGGNVTEIEPDPSLERAANGIITDVATSVANNSSIVSLIGSGFGEEAGSVVLVRTGGVLEPANLISNGWSPSVVQVAATPGTSYDSVILTRADTEIAVLAASFPASFTSQPIEQSSGVPVITSITSFPLGIRLEGSGFLNATYLKTWRAGQGRFYDQAGWFGQNGGTWTDTVLEIQNDFGADDLDPVDQVQVESSTGDTEIITAPDLGGPWAMDDPDTIPEPEPEF